MQTCSVVLTFESLDEILWCDHSNEPSSAVLLHGTVCFSTDHNSKQIHAADARRGKTPANKIPLILGYKTNVLLV